MNMLSSKKFTAALLCALVFGLLFSSCKSGKVNSGKDEESVLIVENEAVSFNEFEYIYRKNNGNSEDFGTEASIREYLDLYTKFKLKVRAAKDLGYDTTAAFRREFENYRAQLAEPYLTERSVTDKLVKEAHSRLGEVLRASHILVRVSEFASPADTLKAFNKMEDIREKALKNPDSFADLAEEYSEDPSAAKNKGDLGYFTALQMVYPFESKAYESKVGEISEVFRTAFGYHIMKLEKRFKSPGSVKMAHIMVRLSEGMPKEDSVEAARKISEIKKKLDAGEDWKVLAGQFSEDIKTRQKGGELPWRTAGTMLPSFFEAGKDLEKDAYSEPFRSPYGFHIIKILDRKEPETLEEMKETLEEKVSKDSRAELRKEYFIRRVKKESGFREDSDLLANILKTYADKYLTEGKWKYKDDNSEQLSETLFSHKDSDFTVRDFFDYLIIKQAANSMTPEAYMRKIYEQFVGEQLTGYEEAHLAEKNTEFAYLLREYYEGILLFKIMEENVWQKAVKDKDGLTAYFENNQDKYLWKARAQATIYDLSKKDKLKQLKEDLKKPYHKLSNNSLNAEMLFDKQVVGIQPASRVKLKSLGSYMQKNKDYVMVIFSVDSDNEAAPEKFKNARFDNIKKQLAGYNIDQSRIILHKGELPTEVRVLDAKTKEAVMYAELFSKSERDLERLYNVKKPLTLQIKKDNFEQGENKALDQIETWEPGTYEVELDGRFKYIKIEEVEKPRQKTLEETRGQVISDYQEFLEREWLKKLEEKYDYSLNEDAVKKLIKKTEK